MEIIEANIYSVVEVAHLASKMRKLDTFGVLSLNVWAVICRNLIAATLHFVIYSYENAISNKIAIIVLSEIFIFLWHSKLVIKYEVKNFKEKLKRKILDFLKKRSDISSPNYCFYS